MGKCNICKKPFSDETKYKTHILESHGLNPNLYHLAPDQPQLEASLLPKDQQEVDEWRRLQGQKQIIDELDELFEREEFETFYESPASSVLSPWLDKRRKEISQRLDVLYEIIKQRYEL